MMWKKLFRGDTLETRIKSQGKSKKGKYHVSSTMYQVPSTMYGLPRRGKEFVDVQVGGEKRETSWET
ncbi:MAG: hypothetical protein ACXIUQ_03220 [Cecembia sp.]